MSDIKRQVLLFYHLFVEFKKKKQMIAHIKTKTGSHTQKQTSVYQCGEEKRCTIGV